MRFNHLARLFYEWGWQINHEHYVAFSDYLKEMLKRDRVFIIKDGEEIVAIAFFYLTDDYKTIYKKSTWTVANDLKYGKEIYIDKLVCKSFSRNILRYIQEAIEDKFPNVEVGVWHRAPYDKCVKVYRKGVKNELQSTLR